MRSTGGALAKPVRMGILCLSTHPLAVESDELRLRPAGSCAGHEVVEAHEGHAGLAFCSETPVDVVVVNLTLPDMDGVEFIRQLRHGCPKAKVVAIASRRPYGAPDPLAIVKRLSDVRGLRWPFTPDQLLSAVREVLEARN